MGFAEPRWDSGVWGVKRGVGFNRAISVTFTFKSDHKSDRFWWAWISGLGPPNKEGGVKMGFGKSRWDSGSQHGIRPKS